MHPLRSYGRIRLGGHISEGLADGVVMMPMKSSHDIRSGKRRFDYVVLG
jgi:predicted RecA/RadA family phage recombinase